MGHPDIEILRKAYARRQAPSIYYTDARRFWPPKRGKNKPLRVSIDVSASCANPAKPERHHHHEPRPAGAFIIRTLTAYRLMACMLVRAKTLI